MWRNALEHNLRPIAIIAVIIIVLLSSGDLFKNTNYNRQFETNFMNGCEDSGVDESVCSCIYSDLQRQYTYSQALQLNNDPTSKFAQTAFRGLASECRGKST